MKDKELWDEPIVIPPVEELTERDRACRDLVHDAVDFETLYETIRQMMIVRGTGAEYSAEKLIGYIEQVRKGDMDINYITRTYGLRDKVQELLGAKSNT